MKLLLTICFCVLAFSKTLNQENEKLRRTNQLLMQALNELAVGGGCVNTDNGATDRYGETCASWYDFNPSTCGKWNTATFKSEQMCCGCGGGSGDPKEAECQLVERKSCNGPKQELTEYNRLANARVARFGKGSEMGCLGSCEYFGLDGCCQWDTDTDQCWFSRTGSTYDDDHGKQVMTSDWGEWPMQYGMVYWRKSGMCKWNGPLKMVEVKQRESPCDWNGKDKTGRREKKGVSGPQECQDFCMQYDDCTWAQVKGNLCRAYRTCSYDGAWYGYHDWRTWQKINADAHIMD